MILPRLFSLIMRFAEFVCGTVVLGLVGHFLRIHHKTGQGPHGREIYTEVIAAISVVVSLLFLLPFTSSFMHYPLDLILSLAYFAAFGALVNQVHRMNCGGAFAWNGILHGGVCSQWKAAEAFSFLSAIFWLVSTLLSIYVFHKVRGRDTVAATGGTANGSGAGRRRPWSMGRKSQV